MTAYVDPDLKKNLIKQQACFAKLTAEEIEMLSELLTEENISKGTIIVTQGEAVDSVYFITTGIADVRKISIQNNQQIFKSLAKLEQGQTIGLSDTGFYSLNGIRTATVVAESDMVVYRLSVPAFNGFALAYPHVNEVMGRN